jgi:hypothetical protein
VVKPGPKRVTRIRGSMQEAVELAVADMHWLKPSDQALVALAVKYAGEIDKAGDDQRAIGYLGQQLMGALRSLGGMPAERKALDIEGAVGGRLAELRKARQRRPPAVDSSAAGVDA